MKTMMKNDDTAIEGELVGADQLPALHRIRVGIDPFYRHSPALNRVISTVAVGCVLFFVLSFFVPPQSVRGLFAPAYISAPVEVQLKALEVERDKYVAWIDGWKSFWVELWHGLAVAATIIVLLLIMVGAVISQYNDEQRGK